MINIPNWLISHLYWHIKQKSVRSIRSSIANRHVQSKTLISGEAKKLLYQKYFYSFNVQSHYHLDYYITLNDVINN